MQAVCKELYKHKFLLEPPPLPAIPEIEEPQESMYKPRATEKYNTYNDVLPSAKTVNYYKQEILTSRNLRT